eukprot:2767855-Alexandrium_andersonii.AAC.1
MCIRDSPGGGDFEGRRLCRGEEKLRRLLAAAHRLRTEPRPRDAGQRRHRASVCLLYTSPSPRD